MNNIGALFYSASIYFRKAAIVSDLLQLLKLGIYPMRMRKHPFQCFEKKENQQNT